MNSLKSILGPVMQMAYVPKDFDAALKYWTEVMGVGPFFMISDSGLENVRFKGKPSSMRFGLALAYWGDVQIELIKLNNDEPSMYKDWLDSGKEGVQHVCSLTDNFDAAMKLCEQKNMQVLHQADVPGGGSVAYVDTGGGDGMVLEILQPAPGSDELFEMMRQAGLNWDGSDPLRVLG